MTSDNDQTLGAWIRTNTMCAAETAALAASLDSRGYSTLWFPEILGREAFTQASWLLANSSKLQVATGIANIYLRDPHTTIDPRNRRFCVVR